VTLLLGQKGPPLIDELEEREIDRYFAKLATSEQIYLVDEGVVAVLEDAIREHNRKVGKDDEQQERREAIDEAMLEER
jgi:hypothetical protein